MYVILTRVTGGQSKNRELEMCAEYSKISVLESTSKPKYRKRSFYSNETFHRTSKYKKEVNVHIVILGVGRMGLTDSHTSNCLRVPSIKP